MGPLDRSTSPGRSILYALLLFCSGRRGRTLILLSMATFLFMCLTWSGPESPVYYQNLKNYKIPTFQMPKWSLGDSKPIANPSLSPLGNKTLGLEDELKDGFELAEDAPSFHFLVTLPTSPVDYCRSILSALLNDYPPPTVIRADNALAGATHAHTSPDLNKILSVKDYLHDSKHVSDEDLVLIVEGFGTWFQLPSRILVDQYQQIQTAANAQLLRKHGTMKIKQVDSKGRTTTVTMPRFNQSIVFGAEKLCRPNPDGSPACQEIPESPLDHNTYGDQTDDDIQGYKNRPKYLESGTIIGSAAALRAFYDAAYEKALHTSRRQQYIFAEMFGEQEKARRLSNKKGGSSLSYKVDKSGNVLDKGDDDDDDDDQDESSLQPVEFGMGLDYHGHLWQTTSRLADDELKFFTHNSWKPLNRLSAKRPLKPKLKLPGALPGSRGPFADPEPHTRHQARTPSQLASRIHSTNALPDTLPNETEWRSVRVAQNTYTGAVPAVIVFPELEAAASHTASLAASHAGIPGHAPSNATTTTTTSAAAAAATPTTPADRNWWPRMWFHAHARALLHRTLRWPPADVVVSRGKGKAPLAWRVRSGRGGVWVNAGREWLSWAEFCPAVEDDVFQDGAGPWRQTSEAPARV